MKSSLASLLRQLLLILLLAAVPSFFAQSTVVFASEGDRKSVV